MFGSFVVNKQLQFQSSLLCVDTGERGFPGPEGQKGRKLSSVLHTWITDLVFIVADLTQA